MQVGDEVEVTRGPFNGCRGTIKTINNLITRAKVKLHYSNAVEIIDMGDLKSLSHTQTSQHIFTVPSNNNITISNGMVFADPNPPTPKAPARCTCGAAATNDPGHWADCALRAS